VNVNTPPSSAITRLWFTCDIWRYINLILLIDWSIDLIFCIVWNVAVIVVCNVMCLLYCCFHQLCVVHFFVNQRLEQLRSSHVSNCFCCRSICQEHNYHTLSSQILHLLTFFKFWQTETWTVSLNYVDINYFDTASQTCAFRMLKPENFHFQHGIKSRNMHMIQLFECLCQSKVDLSGRCCC